MASSQLNPTHLRQAGELVLGGGLGLAVLSVVLLAIFLPAKVVVVPFVLLGVVICTAVPIGARALYVLATAGFFATATYGEGFQIEEVVYGLFYLGYLGLWMGSRLLTDPRRLFYSTADLALFFFLGWSTLSLTWSLAFGADISRMLTDWVAVSMLTFYFPTREIVRRYPEGARIVLGVLVFLGIAVAARNLINYRSLLMSAAMAWQLSRGRVVTNEVLLLTAGLITLMTAVYAQRRSLRLASLIVFAPLFVSLIVTQSRAFWVDFAVGGVVMFVLMRQQHRWRFARLGIVSFSAVTVFASIFLGDLLYLVFNALLDRLLTLKTAVRDDLSLISRFYEAKAVWTMIRENPVVGYGLGVPFKLYDIIDDVTEYRTFVHNGYVGLMYKAGLIGTFAMLYAWAHFIWQAWQVSRVRSWMHPIGVLLVAGLVSLIPSASTAHQFYSPDISLSFALLAGCAAGLRERASLPLVLSPSVS